MLTLCDSSLWQKQPVQNFEAVRYSFANGFEEGIQRS